MTDVTPPPAPPPDPPNPIKSAAQEFEQGIARLARLRRVIVPTEAIRQLAATSMKMTDKGIAILTTAGQIAERLDDPNVLLWLRPYVVSMLSEVDDFQAIVRAILAEQPDPEAANG